MENNEMKDKLISVLTETVETQKDVIEHLERCIDYSNDINNKLKNDVKSYRLALYFSAIAQLFMISVFIHYLTM